MYLQVGTGFIIRFPDFLMLVERNDLLIKQQKEKNFVLNFSQLTQICNLNFR